MVTSSSVVEKESEDSLRPEKKDEYQYRGRFGRRNVVNLNNGISVTRTY